MKKLITTFFIFITIACSKDNSTLSEAKRSFYMATTDFPYANSVDATIESFDLMLENTDMVMMHFDNGVPWQQALDGTDYPQSFINSITFKRSKIPPTHAVYLSMTPISFLRNGLAENIGDFGSESLSSPWDSYDLDNVNVIRTYINHCKFMIDFFNPTDFSYTIEANMLLNIALEKWPNMVNLLKEVYTSLKADYPNLPIFFSIQAGFYYEFKDIQSQKLPEILPYTDYIAVSAYPFTKEPNPELLPADYFSTITNLAPEKSFAIAETTWPAEDLTSPYPVVIPANEEYQSNYLSFLLENANTLNAEFVSWFLIADYDQMWESDLKNLPNVSILRIWKDSGLYDGNLTPRKAQKLWQNELLKIKQ